MSPNLEIEYKTLLSQTSYDHLLGQFSSIKPVEQTNYYFDTKRLFLRSNKCSLRIRVFADRAEMTLKIPQRVGNLEHNYELTLDEANHMISAKALNLELKAIAPLITLLRQRHIQAQHITLIGHLTTLRYEMATPIGLMALDKNNYSNRTDYELELEVHDAKQGKQDFYQFLEDNHITFKYAKSKVVRFLMSIGKIKRPRNRYL